MAASNRRIQRELAALVENPLNFIQHLALSVNNEGLQQLTGVMIGPENSPYVGGHFRFIMTFPPEYPFQAPSFVFATAICHQNVHSGTGATSADILFTGWKPQNTIGQVLEEIHLLLANPNDGSPIEADTMADKSPAKAREWTLAFAQDP
jgi:ubiquitin-conjugating enzyme E2 D/E